MSPFSLDFADGSWDITATATTWGQSDNGFSYWWEATAPATFHVQDSTATQWLQGSGSLNLTVFAADSSYTSIDDFMGMHTVDVSGALTGGFLNGYSIEGGSFSMAPAPISAATLTVDSGLPVSAPGGAQLVAFLPTVVEGVAEPTPEPTTIVLLLASGCIAGALHRRRHAG